MKDWNEFHRGYLVPSMKFRTKEERREINTLITDMRSSLKWVQLNECVKIFEQLKTFKL